MKLACIFIIIMFCLSPLGAAHLDMEDNNTKGVSKDTNSINCDDVNYTIVDHDDKTNHDKSVEVKNQTVETKDIKDTKDSDDTEDKRSKLLNPNLNLHIVDIYKGESVVVEVTADKTFTQNVEVKLTGVDKVYPVKVEDGSGKITIDGLAPKEYTATIDFDGDSSFLPSSASETFTVKDQVDPGLNIRVESVAQGEKPIAKVTANSSLNGVAVVKVNSSDNEYFVNIVDGAGSVKIIEDLEPGDYSATVNFKGDKLFKPSEKTTNFKVTEDKGYKKIDPNLNLHIVDIYKGESVVVEVTADKTFTQNVEVKLTGVDKVYPVKVEDGSGKITIDGLAPKEYTATIDFDGDSSFLPSSASETFTVKDQVDPGLNIRVESVAQGEKPIAKVTANSSLNGVAVVKVNSSDNEYFVNIVDGAGSVKIIEDLEPGDYSATVNFKGDKLFKPSEKTTNFKVTEKELADPNLSISVKDINKGENPVAVIRADSSLNGFMDVQLNNSDEIYPVKIVDGAGNVTITKNLKPGTYSATVSFDGDKTFKPSEDTTSFTIKEDPELKINVKNVAHGKNAVVDIKANNKFNQYVEVKLNNSNTIYTVKVVDGVGNIKIPDILPAGEYTATVSYGGNNVFMPCESSTTFTVMKKGIVNPGVSISVSNINKGEKPVAVIHANNTLSGFMDVKLNNSATVYPVKVTNGVGNVTINENIAPGKYSATVVFDGDNTFESAEDRTVFTVKEDPALNIKVDDVTQGEDIVVEVKANNTFNHYVEVKLNSTGDAYPVKVVDGYGKTIITDKFAPADYVATVSYGGDDTFMAGEDSTNFKVMRESPNLSIKVDDIIRGDKVFAEINANDTLNGIVEVKLSNSDKSYFAKIVNGYGNLTIDEELAIGKYSATVSFEGNEKFRAEEKSTSFNVDPRGLTDPKITLEIENINKGDHAVAVVHANDSLSGIMELKLNNSGSVYPIKVVDGVGKVTITENLLAGKYLATVNYIGDDTFKAGEDSVEFTVKQDPELQVSIENITYGEDFVAKITANSSFNGYVNVKMGGSSTDYVAKVVDGVGSVKFAESLNPGNYTITAKYAGDDTFYASKTTTSFTVMKYSPDLSISVDDIYVGEDAVAEIKANSSLNEYVEVKFSNSETIYPVKLVNGEGTVKISNLPYGDYSVTVTFNGNENFRAEQKITNFAVNRFDPNLSVKVNDIHVSEKDVANVNANSSLNGIVNIKLNNSDAVYTVKLVNGAGSVTIDEDLAAGNYIATASFDGDDKFLPSEKTGAFVVNKNDANLMIKVQDIKVGEKAVAEIQADKRLNGIVKVSLKNSNSEFAVNVVDGHGNLTIDEDLAAGSYIATASFASDDMFLDDEASVSFDVKKNSPDFQLKINDIIETEKLAIEIKADSRLNGFVEIKLNDSDEIYHVKVVNGSAKLQLDKVFTPGVYSATLGFNGDSMFLADEKTVPFTVKDKASALIDPNMNIQVKNITFVDNAVVSLSTNTRFTGNVDVQVGTKNYVVKVTNGKGSVSIPNLAIGTYSVKATFKQDDVFKNSTKSTKFAVQKATPTITASAKTFLDTQKTKQYFITLKNKGKVLSNKKVTLKVDGVVYSAKTNAKGVATFKMTKLTKLGAKNAVISFAGDKDYNKISSKSKITVKFATIGKGNKRTAMVKKIQRALKNNKFYVTYKGKSLKVDGVYGYYTVIAVKLFQKAKKLQVTGSVDQNTAKKLKII